MSKPFFARLLPRTERREISKIRKRPPNVDVYRRAQAVHFSSEGLKVQQIAEIVGRSRISVTRWLHNSTHTVFGPCGPAKVPAARPRQMRIFG